MFATPPDGVVSFLGPEFWVQAAMAVFTLVAVLVALFGQAFRNKFFPPKLSIELVSEEVSPIPVVLSFRDERTGQIFERTDAGRYFHINVRNDRRWAVAHHVQVVLLRLEELDMEGSYSTTWTGDLPLTWRHAAAYPPSRSLGKDATADLFNIVRDKWLEIATGHRPTNLHRKYSVEEARTQAVDLKLTVQATCDEADSNTLQIHVRWNGKWSAVDEEMRQCLQVEKVEI